MNTVIRIFYGFIIFNLVSGQDKNSSSSSTVSPLPKPEELKISSIAHVNKNNYEEDGSTSMVCDFCLYDGEGNFSSYDYPAPYRKNLDCTYRVKRVDESCHLEITFHEFDLQGESDSQCINDYLLINGKRYCGTEWKGKTELVPFYPELDEITFKFQTDGNGSGKGFWMEVKRQTNTCSLSLQETCDRSFAGEEFVIRSPNHPSNYENDQQCQYHIYKQSKDVCGLEFTFLTFNVEPSDNCTYDYLEVAGKKLCGTISSNAIRVFMFSEEQILTSFKSDKQNSRPGFNIKVRQITKCYSSKLESLSSPAPPSAPSCNIRTSKTSGEISSWGYPLSYANNLICQYTIFKNSDDYCHVKVEFVDFDIDFTIGCTGDYLQAGSQKFCGSSLRRQKRNYQFNPSNSVIFLFKSDSAATKKGFRFKYEQVSCSLPAPIMATVAPNTCQFVFDQKEFFIRSPNYPSNYNNNHDCQYVIRRHSTKICALEIKFNYFDVESSTDCVKDYLEVNGEKYCSKYNSKIIRTFPFQTNDKVITFHSDSANAKSGFFLLVVQQECDPRSAAITSDECNQSFRETEFELRSPGYPSQYSNDLNCQFVIHRADDSICDIAINVQDFQLQEGEVCENDYLQIAEERLCGNIDFGTVRTYDFGSQDQLVLNFESDRTINGRGFLLNVLQRNCNATDMPPFATTNLPHKAVSPKCDRIIRDVEDVVYSPQYPSSYPDGTDCRYEVVRISEKYCELEITINNLHIQVGNSCQFDYLDVDGHRFCGSTTAGNKRIFTFKTSRIMINFHSDSSVNDRGFEVSIKQRECLPSTTQLPGRACNQVYNSREFLLTSPNFPKDYTSSLDCRYIIRKSQENVCKLEMMFLAFDVESSSNCEYDYLEINGEKVCGVMENVTRAYNFQEYEKVLTFRTDSGTARGGFMIRVVQKQCDGDSAYPQTPCNQQFLAPNFHLKSPNYPSQYDSNSNCAYQIKRSHKNICSLEVNFLAFDVESSEGCQYDYLLAGNEKLCGVYPPNLKKMIKFEKDEITFEFHSDGATTRPGFSLQINQIDCSGQDSKSPGLCDQTFTNVSGVFSSPQYPHKYPNNMQCTYAFVAQPSYCRLQLTFLEFNLQTENSLCHNDYLEIGKIKYCGPQLLSQTRTITFYGSPREILLLFKSDSSLDDKGFYATFKQLPCSTDAARSPKLPKRPPIKGGYSYSCDRLYASQKFQIISPNHPNNYPEDMECRYTIRHLNNKICHLQFTFDSFDVESSENCEYDFFEINGQRLCGSIPESTIRVFKIQEYQTIVRFHSDSANTRSGFVIKVSQMECQPKMQPQPDFVLPGKGSHPPLVVAEPPNDGEHFNYPPHLLEDYEPLYGPPPLPQPQYPDSSGNGFNYRDCDRTFQTEAFEIRSVNFPSNYPNSLNCRYIVIKAHDDICWVKLTFIRFDVEASDDCQFDYLSINNKRICGTLPEDDIRAYIFTSDEISMYFRSDAATSHRGFQIKGEQLPCRPGSPSGPSNQPVMSSSCDRIYDKDLFVIQSPEFPNHYPDSVDCEYTVRKSNKYICRLELTVLQFDIEDDDECMKDYLFFGDEKMCGSIPAKISRSVLFNGPEAKIHFHSNEENTGPGFSVLVKQFEDCLSRQRSALSTCNETFAVEKFVFHSPLFPDDYPENTECHYDIQRSSRDVCGLELMILTFDIQDKSEGNCSNDYLEIGENNRICGYFPTGYKLKVHFNGDNMNFKFKSDLTTEKQGFSIQVHQVTSCDTPKSQVPSVSSSSDCDATFNAPEFSIRSPHFPNDYPHNVNCTYTIQSSSDEVCALELWFAHFDIEEGPECSYDYFDLGHKKICGKLPSGYSRVINLDSPVKSFTFRSDKGTSKTGFAIKVKQISNCGSTWKPATPPPAMCTHCLKESRGHLTSPSYPDDYKSSLNCSYHIERVKGFCALEIYFHDFHLQQSHNCSRDYVQIDKERFCGLELKRQIKKLDFPLGEPNEVVLIFHTDYEESATGFHAEYRQIPCRGHPWKPGHMTEEEKDTSPSWMPMNRSSLYPDEIKTDHSNVQESFVIANNHRPPYQFSRYSFLTQADGNYTSPWNS